jgi:Mrp family chromosome partitioning ATPase
MPERTVRAHAFASVKGGVGKSALAIFAAKFLALQNRKPLLVDCDMTGTSFADGLRLCAPKVTADASGALDVLQPPTGEPVAPRDGRRCALPAHLATAA